MVNERTKEENNKKEEKQKSENEMQFRMKINKVRISIRMLKYEKCAPGQNCLRNKNAAAKAAQQINIVCLLLSDFVCVRASALSLAPDKHD